MRLFASVGLTISQPRFVLAVQMAEGDATPAHINRRRLSSGTAHLPLWRGRLLQTHSKGGLTELDFNLAERIDTLAE